MLQSEAVKLSCRHLWKVYAEDRAPYFGQEASGADADDLAARLRNDGAIPAAVDVGFDVHVGEIFVIMGLSGSGKSTVIRCLSRLVEPTYGEVLLDGEDLLTKSQKDLIDIRRHKMGMVFQNFGLMPHLNVYDNIAFPLSLQGIAKAERKTRAERVIQLVGLEGRESAFPNQLSGGQQQRVGIARSLAIEPEVWFLDEPFSALDPLIRRQMQDEFLRIQSTLRKSIVFITHDFLEALRIADRMMIMRDGRCVQIGTPAELITNPADSYVADFTEDVPMARVLRARDVLDPDVALCESMERHDCETPVEELLPRLATCKEGVAACQGDRALGVVTANSVIAALAHQDKFRTQDADANEKAAQ
ncbi:MAG: ATP-binding cassette domain-containing protein [Pseudomonadota bacterium]